MRVERPAPESHVEESVERRRPAVERLVRRPPRNLAAESHDLRIRDLTPVIFADLVVLEPVAHFRAVRLDGAVAEEWSDEGDGGRGAELLGVLGGVGARKADRESTREVLPSLLTMVKLRSKPEARSRPARTKNTARRQPELPSGSGVTLAMKPGITSESSSCSGMNADASSSSPGHHGAVGHTGATSSADASGNSRKRATALSKKNQGGFIQLSSCDQSCVHASAASARSCEYGALQRSTTLS